MDRAPVAGSESREGNSRRRPLRLLRSPAGLFLLVLASLTAFEGLHRGLDVHPVLSSTLLSLVYVPLLVWAVAMAAAAVLAEPDNVALALAWAFGFAALTILFFGIVYAELGIVAPDRPGAVIRTFSTCLYFSAATFTTVGYGDFAPAPDSRLLASIEALTGYVIMGTITAIVFFLLSRWADRMRDRGAP